LAIRSGGLHAEGHLEGVDARGDLRVADFIEAELVQSPQAVLRVLLQVGIDTARIGEIENRFAAAAEGHALVDGRQETAAPVGVAARRSLAAGAEDDEAG
jgi:hypothetical protein